MTDRRSGTWCLLHDQMFQECPCDERRNTTDVGLQILVCVNCNRHVARCECEDKELEIRGAA